MSPDEIAVIGLASVLVVGTALLTLLARWKRPSASLKGAKQRTSENGTKAKRITKPQDPQEALTALLEGKTVLVNSNEVIFNPTKRLAAADFQYADYLWNGCQRALVHADEEPWELFKGLLHHAWDPTQHGSAADIREHGYLCLGDDEPLPPVFFVRNSHGFAYLYRYGYICNGTLKHRFD